MQAMTTTANYLLNSLNMSASVIVFESQPETDKQVLRLKMCLCVLVGKK